MPVPKSTNQPINQSTNQPINQSTNQPAIMLTYWRRLAAAVCTEINVYRRVLRHPRTPRLTRWLLGFALLYLLSPIDLIPDWLPILGQLDDLVLVPLLIRLAVKRIPAEIMDECRAAERRKPEDRLT